MRKVFPSMFCKSAQNPPSQTISLNRKESLVDGEVKVPSYSSNPSQSDLDVKIFQESPGLDSQVEQVRITRCVLNDTLRISRVPRQKDCSEDQMSDSSSSNSVKIEKVNTVNPQLSEICESFSKDDSDYMDACEISKNLLKCSRELRTHDGKEAALKINQSGKFFRKQAMARKGTLLSYHSQKYSQSVERLKKDLEQTNQLVLLTRQMRAQRIDCIKYNYSLHKEVQNHKSFDSHLQISEDGETLLIINRRPVVDEVFVLEADPDAVLR